MKWVTAKTMPIIFFMGGMVVSLLTVIVVFVLRLMGVTNISILAASSIFGLVCIITIVWYVVLALMGKLKFSNDESNDFSSGVSSIGSDDDWE